MRGSLNLRGTNLDRRNKGSHCHGQHHPEVHRNVLADAQRQREALTGGTQTETTISSLGGLQGHIGTAHRVQEFNPAASHQISPLASAGEIWDSSGRGAHTHHPHTFHWPEHQIAAGSPLAGSTAAAPAPVHANQCKLSSRQAWFMHSWYRERGHTSFLLGTHAPDCDERWRPGERPPRLWWWPCEGSTRARVSRWAGQ